MATILIMLKVNPMLAIPVGLVGDLGTAYMIAQIIKSF